MGRMMRGFAERQRGRGFGRVVKSPLPEHTCESCNVILERTLRVDHNVNLSWKMIVKDETSVAFDEPSQEIVVSYGASNL